MLVVEACMISINALELRNHLGDLLDSLAATGEPLIVTRARKPTAAIITIEQFKRRFLDYQAESDRRALQDRIRGIREDATADSLAELRALRGYKD
jgi:prevent-host-death family protein